MLRKLAGFNQSRENTKFFGARSVEANRGTCYAYAIQWLRSVSEIGGVSPNDAARRMEILRTSWHDIRQLDGIYRSNDYKTSPGADARNFTDLCQRAGRSVVAADVTQAVSPASGTALTDIPTQATDPDFKRFYAGLEVPGLKSVTFQYVGGFHALGVMGCGDRILYFDPNDGEYEMDEAGFFSALRQHAGAPGEDQLLNLWYVTLL